jgi:hypothetical protein
MPFSWQIIIASRAQLANTSCTLASQSIITDRKKNDGRTKREQQKEEEERRAPRTANPNK